MCVLCYSSLKMVSEATVESFKKKAETIIEERGAVPALAAALAVISGSTSDKQISILTSRTVCVIRCLLLLIIIRFLYSKNCSN